MGSNGLPEADLTIPAVWRIAIAVEICQVGSDMASREDGVAVHGEGCVGQVWVLSVLHGNIWDGDSEEGGAFF